MWILALTHIAAFIAGAGVGITLIAITLVTAGAAVVGYMIGYIMGYDSARQDMDD
jgi:hypothetical protein